MLTKWRRTTTTKIKDLTLRIYIMKKTNNNLYLHLLYMVWVLSNIIDKQTTTTTKTNRKSNSNNELIITMSNEQWATMSNEHWAIEHYEFKVTKKVL